MARNPVPKAVAAAYNRALALEKAGDRDAAVTAYREVLAMDAADRGGAAIRLAAMGAGDVPASAPPAYVEMLFDQQAEAFEYILVDQLGYGVPGLIGARLQALEAGPFENLLDLGCGTGLCGEVLRSRAACMTGIDVSENMVGIAYDKEVYDNLYVAELADYLGDNDEAPFDLIVAADVLPYLGELQAIFAQVAKILVPGGLFAFSTERLGAEEADDYRVLPHQRFGHRGAYVQVCLEASRFEILEMTPINVRMQDGVPTPGDLVIARLEG